MKIIVFSDSHRDVDTMIIAANYEQPDMIIHLGDCVGDTLKLKEAFPEIPMEYVKGNCDFTTHCKSENILIINGKKIFITHGHRYSVKMGMTRLINYGMYSEVDIVLFGHTHFPYLQQHEGVWVMNPGRGGRISGRDNKTSYGLITFNGDDFKCEIVHQS